jgi:hypothetical protein
MNLILALAILALCALIACAVLGGFQIETLRVGGLYHWRLRGTRGIIFGGSFYRPARARKNPHA